MNSERRIYILITNRVLKFLKPLRNWYNLEFIILCSLFDINFNVLLPLDINTYL